MKQFFKENEIECKIAFIGIIAFFFCIAYAVAACIDNNISFDMLTGETMCTLLTVTFGVSLPFFFPVIFAIIDAIKK